MVPLIAVVVINYVDVKLMWVEWVDIGFSLALVINASLFIIQFAKIIYHRSAQDISLITFCGFLLIQFVTLLHGFFHHDNALLYGTLLSFLTCFSVIMAIIVMRYKTPTSKYPATTLEEPSFAEIISLIPANVYWINREGIFLGCNQQMLSMLKLSSVEEYRGKTYEDLYEQSHIKIIKETDQKVMNTNKAMTIEEVAVPYKVYLTNKIPLHNKKGNVIGLLGVSIDITLKKQMEKTIEQLKKREIVENAKSEFLYNMRHDIRTPLANVIGLTQVLNELEKNVTKKALIHDIITSADSLMDLLNEMLEFSHIEEGFYPVKTLRFNLEETLQKIKSMMSAAISRKGLNFTIHYPPHLPKIVLGDIMRTHRILLNLASNAIKYTEAGEITITVELLEETTRQYYLKMIVQDTGKGIPIDKLDSIFDKFTKLSPSYESDAGTGLGLAIVKEFIQDIEGEIYVESKEGEGSQFICIIPYLKPLEAHIKNYHGDYPNETARTRITD